jgi:CheY-like chemotaxis protein
MLRELHFQRISVRTASVTDEIRAARSRWIAAGPRISNDMRREHLDFSGNNGDIDFETNHGFMSATVILMSGYGGAQLSERAQAAGVIDVLRKPLVRRDIAEPVARTLQARN